MDLLLIILLSNLLGSVISLIGGILLLFRKGIGYKFSHYLSSFAAGTLLGTAFFALLPGPLEHAEEANIDSQLIFTWTLCGIIFFFLLERMLHWFHHHGFDDHAINGKPIVPLIIVGDSIHNFIDGIAIAATFMVSIPAGIVTTLAVGAHEIPQEIGDFGIMLKNGISRLKALIFNILSACVSFIGALLAFYFGQKIEGVLPFFISIAAGFFLYISLSDLIPEIHHENKKGLAFIETFCLIAGIITIYLTLYIIQNVFHITP